MYYLKYIHILYRYIYICMLVCADMLLSAVILVACSVALNAELSLHVKHIITLMIIVWMNANV